MYEAQLAKQRAELEMVKAERDKLQSLIGRAKRDYAALRAISDKYNDMLRNVWNYRERHYLEDMEGKTMHAAMYHVKDWYPLHKEYNKLRVTQH